MENPQKGTATHGDKGAHSDSSDARATQFTPDPRNEGATVSYPALTSNADSVQPGKPYASPGEVRKDDPDPYGVS
jgi:hypothetical protein